MRKKVFLYALFAGKQLHGLGFLNIWEMKKIKTTNNRFILYRNQIFLCQSQ